MMVGGRLVVCGVGLLFIAAPFSISGSEAKPVDRTEPTLCREQEQIIFSCVTGRSKIVSLCAEGNLQKKDGRIQYRFGRSNAIELSYPERSDEWNDAFRFSKRGF